MSGGRIAVFVIAVSGFATGIVNAAKMTSTAGLPARTPEAPRVRVRIASGSSGFRVRGFDLRFYSRKGENARLLRSVDRGSEWQVKCASGELSARQVGGVSGGQGKQEISAGRGESLAAISPAGFLKFDGRLYRSELRLFPVKGGCDVVNVVHLEHYLDGLVNSEFSAAWNRNAISAQVIAARSYALYRIRENPSRHFDLDATIADQVYDGAVKEHYRASRIVKRTAGRVLTSESGAPIKAFYHSVCGGHTQVPERVWGRTFSGFRRGVKCPHCRSAPGFSWSLEVNGKTLAAAIRNAVRDGNDEGTAKARSLKALRIASSDKSGRVGELEAEWGEGGRTRIPAIALRNSLGTTRLKSVSFEVKAMESEWRFEGRGYGHGVGLCQWGAKRMGEKGKTAEVILGHYYPDAALKKLW